MYFDYLTDDPISPHLFLINCKVSKNNVELQLGYLRRMIGNKPIILKDKRNIDVCLLDVPTNIRFLTRDLIVAEKDYLQIPIQENYVNIKYLIYED
jgi:cellulose biosynthesis protein BcsQ